MKFMLCDSIGAVISIPGSKSFPAKAAAVAAPTHRAKTTDENGDVARGHKANKAPEQWLVQRMLKVTNARAPAGKK